MRAIILIFLFVALVTGCKKEVILTEETIPDEIFYIEHSNKPYTGKCLIYYSNTQQIHYILSYKDGILNGPFASYFRNGKAEYQGMYFEGELSGVFKKYNQDGKEALSCVIKD